jgi:hypothetical protein
MRVVRAAVRRAGRADDRPPGTQGQGRPVLDRERGRRVSALQRPAWSPRAGRLAPRVPRPGLVAEHGRVDGGTGAIEGSDRIAGWPTKSCSLSGVSATALGTSVMGAALVSQCPRSRALARTGCRPRYGRPLGGNAMMAAARLPSENVSRPRPGDLSRRHSTATRTPGRPSRGRSRWRELRRGRRTWSRRSNGSAERG